MKEMSASEREKAFVPRVCIFGGKAFATYVQAKRIVKFITDVGSTINHDPEIGDLLKVRACINHILKLRADNLHNPPSSLVQVSCGNWYLDYNL